jgi:hypothetical protein
MINGIESPSSEIIQSALLRGESPPVASGDPRFPSRPRGDIEAAGDLHRSRTAER